MIEDANGIRPCASSPHPLYTQEFSLLGGGICEGSDFMCSQNFQVPADCFGAYIISMATSPSDVLAVELLQRECHVKQPLRVVPLFEKLADLDAAPAAVARLFSIEWYQNRIYGKQEVMIGDSNSGRLSAAWLLYKA
ncbi:putative phosphoenolpyruvate carboxylase [Helianthus annuus]|nr:putative phosphoenolpyruvate carboxylase [Helianthus annuus]